MEQASFFGAEFAPPTLLATKLVKTTFEQHTAIEVHLNSEFDVSSSESKVIGKAVIIATGSIPRKLNLAHEDCCGDMHYTIVPCVMEMHILLVMVRKKVLR